jgi:integrase
MDKKHLKQNSAGSWLYQRKVPKALRDKYSSPVLCVSLETKNLREAQQKRDALNVEIDFKLTEAKNAKPSKGRFNQIYNELRQEHQRYTREVRQDPENAVTFEEAFDPESKPVRKDQTYAAAFEAVIKGEVPEVYQLNINELFEEWLVANDAKKNEKYKSTVKTAQKELNAYLQGDEFPGNIDAPSAQLFIDRLLEEGRSVGTVTHYKSKIAEVWRWGLARGKFEGFNHWKEAKIEATVDQKEQDHFRNLTKDEAAVLLDKTSLENNTSESWPYKWATYSLPRLLPFLGCRRGELAGARKEQVVEMDGRLFFEVWKGKTKNAARIIPVSPIIEPLIKETLARSGSSPWLYPEIMEAEGLTPEKAMNSVSSRFSKLMKHFDKQDGYKVGLHSLRGHFATALEEVGCPEDLAATLAGHKRLSLTYGLYSKHKDKDRLWGFVEKIHTAQSLKPWV